MIRLLLLLVICSMAPPAIAQDNLNFDTFEQLPILDKGRIKPLGAFAKARLKDFHGQDQNASQWLAETIFNPSQALEAKIFVIKDDDLKARLQLQKEKDYFNLQDLQEGLKATREDVLPLLQTDQNALTKQQKDLLKIHEDVISYNELLRSFSLILPINDNQTFIDLMPEIQKITRDLENIVATKGNDFSNYSEGEQNTAITGFQLQQIREGGTRNDDLKIIPVRLDDTLSWVAPWQIVNEGKGSPQTTELLNQWTQIANAYRSNDVNQWNEALRTLHNKTVQIASPQISQTRLKAELLYQNLQPYHLAMGLYAISILLLAISLYKPARIISIAALLSLSAAAIFHATGIGARIYILDRPPVGTLYESVLFVSLICAIVGLITYIKTQKPIIPLTAQIAALALLAIAPVMLQNNDSLELLVAVLNTNFWLATHVLCITAGYGICIIAACLAHAYMFLRIKNPAHILLNGMFQSIHKIGLVALLLTSVGTVLGGIWADQSWGRFWGWDPKENGFTSGIASGLAAFCIFEFITIITLWTMIRTKEKKA